MLLALAFLLVVPDPPLVADEILIVGSSIAGPWLPLADWSGPRQSGLRWNFDLTGGTQTQMHREISALVGHNVYVIGILDGAMPLLSVAAANRRAFRGILLIDPDLPRLVDDMLYWAAREGTFAGRPSEEALSEWQSEKSSAHALRDDRSTEARSEWLKQRSAFFYGEFDLHEEPLLSDPELRARVVDYLDHPRGDFRAPDCSDLRRIEVPIVVLQSRPLSRFSQFIRAALEACRSLSVPAAPSFDMNIREVDEKDLQAGRFGAHLGAELDSRRSPEMLHPDILYAQTHAPRLWLARDEPLYPTLPHPFAFDALDLTGSGPGVDLLDALEVTHLDQAADLDQAMKTFTPARLYARDPTSRLPPVRVLYAPRELIGGLLEKKGGCAPPVECRAELAAGRVPPEVGLLLKRHGVFLPESVAVEAQDHGKWRLKYETSPGAERTLALSLSTGGDIALRRPGGAERDDPVFLTQYWFYYLYDRGPNPHLHDGEHAFVYTRPGAREHTRPSSYAMGKVVGLPRLPKPEMEAEVIAVVGAGHTDDVANNVLVAERTVVPTPILPERLDDCPVILVELGKHASAPDANADGRFDVGMDANLYAQSVWGSRDAQMATFGKVLLNRFQPWFSFPRDESGEGLFQERYQRALLADHEGWLRCRPDRSPPTNTYDLMPVSDLIELDRLLALPDLDSSHRGVEGFLEQHKLCFWGNAAPRQVALSHEVLASMRKWATSHDPKRDVWTHRDFQHPEDVLKRYLFPKLALAYSLRSYEGRRTHRVGMKFAELPLGLLNDETIQLHAGLREGRINEFGIQLDLYRATYTGSFLGLMLSGPGPGRRALTWSGGRAFSMPSLARFGRWARGFSLTVDVGLRGWAAGPRPRRLIGFEAGIGLAHGVLRGRHPLEY